MAAQTKIEAFAVAGEETSNWSARGEEELCGWWRGGEEATAVLVPPFIGRGRGRFNVSPKKVRAASSARLSKSRQHTVCECW